MTEVHAGHACAYLEGQGDLVSRLIMGMNGTLNPKP